MKSGVKIMDRIMVTDLLKQDGKVVGAIGFPMDSDDTLHLQSEGNHCEHRVQQLQAGGI